MAGGLGYWPEGVSFEIVSVDKDYVIYDEVWTREAFEKVFSEFSADFYPDETDG